MCLCLCVVCGAYTCISNTTPLSDLAVIHTLGQGCLAPEGRGWVSLVPGNLLRAMKNSMIICSRICKTFRTNSVIYRGSHTHTWFPTSLTNPQPHMLTLRVSTISNKYTQVSSLGTQSFQSPTTRIIYACACTAFACAPVGQSTSSSVKLSYGPPF